MAFRSIMAAVSALALSGVLATAARADDLLKPDALHMFADRNQWGAEPTHKSFQWDASKGRWGLKFDMDQSTSRDVNWKDVQAGAYYKLTPSLSVGGGVALGDQTMLNSQANPQQAGVATAPRVRLETAFKF